METKQKVKQKVENFLQEQSRNKASFISIIPADIRGLIVEFTTSALVARYEQAYEQAYANYLAHKSTSNKYPRDLLSGIHSAHSILHTKTTVKRLIDLGADINYCSVKRSIRTPLEQACKSNNIKLTKILLSLDARRIHQIESSHIPKTLYFAYQNKWHITHPDIADKLFHNRLYYIVYCIDQFIPDLQ